MADYRRDCGCWTTHNDSCPSSPNYAVWITQQNIKKNIEKAAADALDQGYMYLGMSPEDGYRRQMLFACQRGCGTVVWDTDKHSKNVCVEHSGKA